MKELTMEEKAKRYDKAIERAKDYKNDTIHRPLKVGENIMDYIFPELREESEDERIRKALINYYSFDKDGGSHALDNITPKQIVAWLEKQGEKESVTCPICGWEVEKQGEQKSKFRVGDTIKCKYDDRQFTIKSVDLDKGTYTYTQEGCGNDIDYADEEFELVEQKPVIKMKTPEESLGTDSETYNKIVDECVYGETKSAWSEEDEKAINDIMWIIEAYRENGFNETHIQMADSSEKWLKSLKERYTWKPSDRQMGVLLSEVTAWTKGCPKQIVLESLYNDLLKYKSIKL